MQSVSERNVTGVRATVKAYLQLVRLPNAFTAAADVVAGFLAAGGWPGDAPRLPWIVLASVCLYSGGIVLNDVCDLEVDRRERPGRPLPSGRVRWAVACGLAAALLAAGFGAAALVTGASAAVAAGLVLLIVLYDAWAKQHPVRGPLFMGSCRFGNVILGTTAVPAAQTLQWIPALLIAGLVVAATILSRDEVGGGRRGGVLGASMGLAAIAALTAAWMGGGSRDAWGWLFLAAFLAFTGPPLVRAWRSPGPEAIQGGVKRMVLGIIPLDAAVAAGAAGPVAGCLVLALLVPSWWIARWIYVT